MCFIFSKHRSSKSKPYIRTLGGLSLYGPYLWLEIKDGTTGTHESSDVFFKGLQFAHVVALSCKKTQMEASRHGKLWNVPYTRTAPFNYGGGFSCFLLPSMRHSPASCMFLFKDTKSKDRWKQYNGVSENSGFSPQIIHLNRVFHYFHHPFWGFSPYFWKHLHLKPLAAFFS